MVTTFPLWISAAAALVTASVTRLVAPVWSLGPQGEGGTSFVQSVCAETVEAIPKSAIAAHMTNSALGVMGDSSRSVKGHCALPRSRYAPDTLLCQEVDPSAIGRSDPHRWGTGATPDASDA